MSDLVARQNPARAYLDGIRDAYTSNALTFLRFLDANGLTVSLEGLREYFSWLNKQGYRAKTVRIKRAAALNRIRRLAALPGAMTPEQLAKLEWAIHEINRDNPAPKLQFQSVGREKVMTLAEYRRTLDACRSDRQRCFVRFLYSTGVRVSEMTGIRLDACTSIMGRVYIVVMGKGRKERTVKITESMFADIRRTFGGSVYLFETKAGKRYSRQAVSDPLRRLTMRAIKRPLSAHKMRHSFATRQLEKGSAVDAVSRYLGHTDTAVTLKFYSHCEIADESLFDDDL